MEDLLSADDLFASVGRYGYLHPGYAEAFAEAGEVRHLRRSGAWLPTRAAAHDADAAADATRFLGGWTGLTRPSYRCGRIVDRLAYDALAVEAGASGSAVFPAYRDGGRP